MPVNKTTSESRTSALLARISKHDQRSKDGEARTRTVSDAGDQFSGGVDIGSFNYHPTVTPIDDPIDSVMRSVRAALLFRKPTLRTRIGRDGFAGVSSDESSRTDVWTHARDEDDMRTTQVSPLVGTVADVAGTSGGKLYVVGSKALVYMTPAGESQRWFDIVGGDRVAVFTNAAPVVADKAGALYALDADKELKKFVPGDDRQLEHLAVTGRNTIVAATADGDVRVFDRGGKKLGTLELGSRPVSVTTIGTDVFAVATADHEIVFANARGEEIARHAVDSDRAQLFGEPDGSLIVRADDMDAVSWVFPSVAELQSIPVERALDPEAAAAAKAKLERNQHIGALTARAEALIDELRADLEKEIHASYDLTDGGPFDEHASAKFVEAWGGIQKKLKANLTRKKADKEVLDDTPAIRLALDVDDWADWVNTLRPDLTGGETFEPKMPEPFRATGATGPERATRTRLIERLVARDNTADARDERRLQQILDTLPIPVLERLSKARYTITVARHRITNAEQDLAGKVNGNGGVAVMADLAEGVHRKDGDGASRITVRSYWKNGEIQVDAGTLLHEIGHAFDLLEAGQGGSLNVEPEFAEAFKAEHQRLDPYFQVQAEFFAEVFARYMLDPDRCARQFPKAFAAFDRKFRLNRPNAQRIHALQNDMRGEISVDVRPDPRVEMDKIEKVNRVRLKQELRTQPYIFTLMGEVGDATHALADELGSRLRAVRSPEAARYRPWEATIRVDANTFNDQAAFQKVLDEQTSSGRGALLYLPNLANIDAKSAGFQLLERHIERFGGLNPIAFAGTKAQMEELQGALPTVVRKPFEVRGLDPEQTAAFVQKIATDEGFELSSEAMEALAENAPGGNVPSAQRLWRRIKTAHADRLGSLVDYVDSDPSCVARILAADITPAVEDRRVANPLDKLDEMVGLEAVKAEVRAIIAAAGLAARAAELGVEEDRPRLNLMFSGNPGTGKTTVAELLADALHDVGYLESSKVAKARVQDLIAGNPEQNIKKLFEENKGGVIFIDEIHQLADTPEGQRAFRAMIPYLGHDDYLDTVFIGAGYPDETRDLLRDHDAGAERRYQTVPFEDYTTEQLGEILDVIADRRKKTLDPEARSAAMDRLDRQRRGMKHFGNGGSVNTVIDVALKRQRTRLAAGDTSELTKEDLTTLTAADFEDGVVLDRDTVLDEIEALKGLDEVKEQLRGIAAMVEFAEAQGRNPLDFVNTYFVFRGPAGAGRDEVARLLGRLLCAFNVIPTEDITRLQGAEMQGRFVGHTTGDVKKMLESAWGGVLYIDQAGGLANSGGGFKDDSISTLINQMKDNRGRFVMIVADTEEGIDDLLDMNDELAALLGETINFQAASPEAALATLEEKLERDVDISQVKDELEAGMEALAAAPRWAGFEDARLVGTQIMKAHANAFVARRKKGERVDAKVLLPEAVTAAFDAAIAEKERRGERKVTSGDGLEYAAEVKVKTKAPAKTEEAKGAKFTATDERLLKAMAKVDLEFAAKFDADPAEAARQEADVTSDYIKRLAEETQTKPATVMKRLEAVRVKITKLVQTESLVEKFEYHCPYCGRVDSGSCWYVQNKPIEWRIEHSLKKPWTERIVETKLVEEEV